jgi:hypothetical protein
MISTDVEDRYDAEELRRLNEEVQAAGESVARAVSAISLFFRIVRPQRVSARAERRSLLALEKVRARPPVALRRDEFPPGKPGGVQQIGVVLVAAVGRCAGSVILPLRRCGLITETESGQGEDN